MQQFVLILAGLVLASGLGYFIGYDHGFEKSITTTAHEEVPTITDAAGTMGALVGTWQSVDDPKFTREFLNDGTVVDRYEGGDDSDGLWMVFTKDIPDASFAGELEEGAIYLSMAMAEDEKYYFKVTRAESTTLELIYLDRGGVLTFTRIL